MPPRQVKPDPQEDSGQESPPYTESPPYSDSQPSPGNTASQGSDTAPGLRFPNVSRTHSLPVIHETEESTFNLPFPGLRGTTSGAQSYSFSYPGNDDIPNPFVDPFEVPEQTHTTRASNMNIMSRNLLPSSRNARNQGLGGLGTGTGMTRRSIQQQAQTGIATNQAVTRATLGQASNPGPFSTVDLTGMDYPDGSPSSMDLYGSTLNSGLDPDYFIPNSYDPFSSTGGGAQQGQGARDTSPVPKFDPELLSDSPQFISPMQYETFEEGDRETKPDPRRLRTEGTPTRAPRNQRTSAAMANISPATPGVNSPGDSSLEASSGGGVGSSGRRAPQTPAYQAHVPPNRIAEAGPVTHPDPEWRPYGTNHWHVFLREPTLLKYLSSTEIKDIREHCYAMAAKGAAAEGGGDNNNDGDQQQRQPVPVARGSQYTTDDAQAVWKHCDAYIRRRSQVRNNQAARRSRQRKDAETRYWKALAVQHGVPDHDFDWDLVDEDGNLPANIGARAASSTRTAAEGGSGGGGGVQTRARARAQQGGGGGGQGQQRAAANRRTSASSGAAARPDFDFNQPLDFDEDDKADASFDPFDAEF